MREYTYKEAFELLLQSCRLYYDRWNYAENHDPTQMVKDIHDIIVRMAELRIRHDPKLQMKQFGDIVNTNIFLEQLSPREIREIRTQQIRDNSILYTVIFKA